MTSPKMRSFLTWAAAVVAFVGGWMLIYTLGTTIGARGTAVDEAGASGYWASPDTRLLLGSIVLILFTVGLGIFQALKTAKRKALEDSPA